MAQVYSLDRNWKFFRGDLAPHTDTEGWGGAKGRSFFFGAAGMNFDDSGWRTVTLPHDFVREGEYTRKREAFVGADRVPDMETIDSRFFAGGSLENGVGWYRRHLVLPENLEGKRIYLHFDGVFRNSTVYFNEHFVGVHESGYTGFTWDVTDLAYIGKENLLCVRVDASGREGWWYEGGGINRHVRLICANQVHLCENGVFVSADPDLSAGRASVRVITQAENHREASLRAVIRNTILDGESEMASAEQPIDLPASGQAQIAQTLSVDKPELWNLANPHLYTLRTEILEDGRCLDSAETAFGIRKIVVDAEKGLLLNGEQVCVRGFCQHIDHAGCGVAVPDEVLEMKIRKIKELGANAVRCSHNPQPGVLDICDRIGLLVLDETRKTSVSTESLNQLRHLVKEDRNHPSVFCWSIGNEEVNLQFHPEAPKIVHTLRNAVRELDDTRPVTMALVYWNPVTGKTGSDLSTDSLLAVGKELDVAGFNYNQDQWDKYRKLSGRQPMMITESTSGAWTRSEYETDTARAAYYPMDPENGSRNLRKWDGSYDAVYRGELMWKSYAERPWLAGYFVWTAFDYRGEPSPMPWPAISTQFGVMDYCGFRKDISYFFESWWTDRDVLHLFPDWNRQGDEGKPVTVHCFSNMDEVELFVNGRSYGRKAMERNGFLRWENVIYEPGTLEAVGYRNGKKVRTETVKTTGAPAKLVLQAENAKFRDTAIVNVLVEDAEGNVVPTADPQIRFTVEGAGNFLGCGNGNPGSHESDCLPVRHAFHGCCQLLVQALENPGKVTVTARAQGIGRAQLELENVGQGDVAFL
ncbi:MAG: glycoside hydrolase family 2 TIM barrel-domain containing protein [Lachnospiraceae bacterium]|jgi:beta-galactosidase